MSDAKYILSNWEYALYWIPYHPPGLMQMTGWFKNWCVRFLTIGHNRYQEGYCATTPTGEKYFCWWVTDIQIGPLGFWFKTKGHESKTPPTGTTPSKQWYSLSKLFVKLW